MINRRRSLSHVVPPTRQPPPRCNPLQFGGSVGKRSSVSPKTDGRILRIGDEPEALSVHGRAVEWSGATVGGSVGASIGRRFGPSPAVPRPAKSSMASTVP
jgi:hypothetical protein